MSLPTMRIQICRRSGGDVVGDGARGSDDDREQTRSSGVANTVSAGVHGSLIQAGVVHGDITIHGRATSPEVVPRQLPAAPSSLVGRAAELRDLDDWAEATADRRLLVAVGGSGGVGKTALGACWLHRRASRFGDGQLYVDLGAASASGPMSVSEALGRCLRALGVASDHVPVELEDRALLYRSITADKSIALLLDNAVSAAQTRPLIPISETSVVVVTSRMRLVGLALEGAKFLDLDPLEDEAGVQLLASMVGEQRVLREFEAALEISRLCSGFPLALSVVSARLLAHPTWSVGELAAQLRDQKGRLSELSLTDDASVQAVLDACCRDLSASAGRLYGLLAGCPGEDFSLELAKGVAGEVGEVKDGVEELVEANLVQELVRHRYRYHDLIRLHASQYAEYEQPETERVHAKQRAVEWYLERSIRAEVTVNPQRWHLGPGFAVASAQFETGEQALGWYEQERVNLVSAVTEAFERQWYELCWQLCEALWSFFLYRKHYQDWISTHQIGITAAQRCGRRLAESRLRCQLSFAYLDLQQLDMATELCEPALSLAEAEGHLDSMSTALSQLAKAERARGNLEGALEYFQRSLALVEQSGHPRGVALRSRRIALVLMDLERGEDALAWMLRSASILHELKDTRGWARALTFLGQLYRRLDRLDEADEVLSKALGVMRSSGSGTYEADVLYELGAVAEQSDRSVQACEFWTKAQQLYHGAGNPRWQHVRDRLEALDFPE